MLPDKTQNNTSLVWQTAKTLSKECAISLVAYAAIMTAVLSVYALLDLGPLQELEMTTNIALVVIGSIMGLGFAISRMRASKKKECALMVFALGLTVLVCGILAQSKVDYFNSFSEDAASHMVFVGSFAMVMGTGGFLYYRKSVQKTPLKKEGEAEESPPIPVKPAPVLLLTQEQLDVQYIERYFDNLTDMEGVPWGIKLKKIAADGYKIEIPRKYYHVKLYGIFTMLKNAGIVDPNLEFNKENAEHYLECCSLENLKKIKALCKAEAEFRNLITQVFGEIGGGITVTTGGKTSTEFLSCAKHKISPEEVDALARTQEDLFFPGSVQISTKNDKLKDLLEKYYRQYGLVAQTFDAKGPHQMHRSLLLQADFEKLKPKLEFLLFIKNTYNLSGRELLNLESTDGLTHRLYELEEEQIKTVITDNQKWLWGPDTMKIFTHKKTAIVLAYNQQTLSAARDALWEFALNQCCNADSDSFLTGLERVTPEKITGLYGSPDHDQWSINKCYNELLKRLKGNERIKNKGIVWEAFDAIARQKFSSHLPKGGSDPLSKNGLNELESIVWLLHSEDTSNETIQNFCNQWTSINWAECEHEFRTKLDELFSCLLKEGDCPIEQRIKQRLMQKRISLVHDFAAIHYGKGADLSTYVNGIRKNLPRDKGLCTQAQGVGMDRIGKVRSNAALGYLTTNYTPYFIFQTVLAEQQFKLKSVQNNDEDLTNFLEGLELSPAEIHEYYDVRRKGYNMAKIHAHFKAIIFKYCCKKNYLFHTPNTTFKSEFLDATYRNTVAAQIAAFGPQGPHEGYVHRGPSYSRPKEPSGFYWQYLPDWWNHNQA